MARKPSLTPRVVSPEAPTAVTVTNDKPGTTLHLGDGRKLAFGESAEVPAHLAGAFNG
jgi:hypothetical protein